MLKKILAALALLAAAAVPAVVAAPPANAAVFTDVTHASDDSGYAAAIKIRCRNDGSYRWLYTGESSVFSSKACGGLGVDAIWVGSGQAVRCKNALPPYQNLYYLAFGWHEVPSYASLKCYMQRPI